MKRKRFKAEQIVTILKEAEREGTTVADVCRAHGISEKTYYRWKETYSGMQVAEVRRLRQLEDENARFEEAGGRTRSGDRRDQGTAQKKLLSAPQRRIAVELLKEAGVSERRACEHVNLSRSLLRYRSVRQASLELQERIAELARKNPRRGYKYVAALLKSEGRTANRKRVHRLWKLLKLQVPRRKRKQRIVTGASVPGKAQHPNHVWTWDFTYDTTADGRTLKCLTVLDEFTRLRWRSGRRGGFPRTESLQCWRDWWRSTARRVICAATTGRSSSRRN